MNPKPISRILAVFLTAVIFSNSVLAAETAPVQKALEGVKAKIEDLATAKDENSTLNDLALRIEAFKKVIDLSIVEAVDLKLRLLAFDKLSEELVSWKEAMIRELNGAAEFYENEKSLLTDEIGIQLETIKERAKQFKIWREENYLKTAEQINDFLLINQESEALVVASKRLQKISDDLAKIEKAKIKGFAELNKMLGEAKISITEAEQINKNAESLFFEKYILPKAEEDQRAADSSKTTNPDSEVSESMMTSTTPAAMTESAAESEVSGFDEEPILEPSIRDLVRDSLMKIKDAYQIFIEMSNSVRKLLK